MASWPLKGDLCSTDLRSVMEMRREPTGGTQCWATSAPLPFSTKQEPACNMKPGKQTSNTPLSMNRCVSIFLDISIGPVLPFSTKQGLTNRREAQ